MASAAWAAWAAAMCLLLMAADVSAQATKSGATPPAAVDDQEARDLFRLGKQAFDEGRYERALKYFKDAYDLSGRAQLQFNIGTVLDRLRRDREAIDAYKSYLAQTPDATNRAVVEERVRLLQDALAKPDGPPVPMVEPTVTQPSAAVPVSPPPTAATVVPSPAQTARAAAPSPDEHVSVSASATASAESSSSVTSRWWFWTGLGALAVGAVVVGVVVGASSTERTLEGPAVLGPSTRVRAL